MKVENWYGFNVILVPHETANFGGTRMALHGILKEGETIEDHRKRLLRRRVEAMKVIDREIWSNNSKTSNRFVKSYKRNV